MKKILNLSLAELAITEPCSIVVLEKYQLDYYQNGMRTLHEACMEKGLDDLLLYNELALQESNPSKNFYFHFEEMGIDCLIGHIKNVYHANESQALPSILNQITDLKINMGKNYPYLVELEMVFAKMKHELITHAGIEEQILFPYAMKMFEMRKHKIKTLSQISLITNPMKMLEFEHEHTGTEIASIRNITNNYEIPEDAPKEYQHLMEDLSDLESEFHQHIHIENNVLFPKIKALERELLMSIRHHL